jgi:hypothetical protein
LSCSVQERRTGLPENIALRSVQVELGLALKDLTAIVVLEIQSMALTQAGVPATQSYASVPF